MVTNPETIEDLGRTPFLWAGLAAVSVILLFWPTVQSIIHIWSVSETFAHGFFVIPVFMWLVWRKRVQLSTLPANPDLLPLVFIAASGAVWLLSKLAGIQVGEQFAFALILMFTLWAVLGRHKARKLVFPLLFLLFLAPMGEELVPVLMQVTADLTVWAIRSTGIPIYREGLFFSLPSGNWSVVEACSGIRYLIASSVLGSLYAYLSYTSLRLRLTFFAISLIVPILANSMRAYLIVMIGHYSGNKLATGVDHLIYGWLFFGVVMFALFSIGSWMQRYDTSQSADANAREKFDYYPTQSESCPAVRKSTGSNITAMVAIFAIVACWPAWSAAINARAETGVAIDINKQLLPHSTVALPSQNLNSRQTQWQPHNSGHDYRLDAEIHSDDLPTVLATAYVYNRQYQGKEMISSGNVLVKSQNDYWRLAQTETRDVRLSDGNTISVTQSSLNSSNQRIIVWQWYRVGNTGTSNALQAKLLEVADRVLMRKVPSVNYMLMINEQEEDHEKALSSALNIITAR